MTISAFAATPTPIDGEGAANPAVGKGEGVYSIGVNGTVTRSDASPIVSVNIAWDAMNFQYRQGDGTWKPDEHVYESTTPGSWSDNKAGISVTNHSNVDIKVAFDFSASESGIIGKFYANESGAYTELSSKIIDLNAGKEGKKEQADVATVYFGVGGNAISSSKAIGAITITVRSTKTTVSTKEELLEAAKWGGTIKLLGDIDLGSEFVYIEQDTVLDLNGHTLNADRCALIVSFTSCHLKNGTVESSAEYIPTVRNDSSELTIEDCTLVNGEYFPLYNGGTAVLKNCTLTGGYAGYSIALQSIYESVPSLEMSGDITMAGDIIMEGEADYAIVAKAGTYDFDPTQYVDLSVFTVTANSADTPTLWTVTAK